MRRARLLGAVAAVSLLVGTPASANTFGYDGKGLYHADSAHHTFYFRDLTPEFHSSMNWARYDALGKDTDMTEALLSTWESSVDVTAYDERYSYSWLGAAVCVRSTGDICQAWEVFLNIAKFDGRHQDERTKTAVHEVGHTVGLGHTTDSTSPMQSGYFRIIRYSVHDRGHINARY